MTKFMNSRFFMWQTLSNKSANKIEETVKQTNRVGLPNQFDSDSGKVSRDSSSVLQRDINTADRKTKPQFGATSIQSIVDTKGGYNSVAVKPKKRIGLFEGFN